jgi:hypothetical protein
MVSGPIGLCNANFVWLRLGSAAKMQHQKQQKQRLFA